MTIKIKPISLRAANAWIVENHRHHGPTRGHKFSVSVVDEQDNIIGVGVAGRPVARYYDADGYIEVTRVATDGTKNACSAIYGALRRAAIALGYEPHKIITYTLDSEDGGSLRASGWIVDGTTAGGSWSSEKRPREDKHPTVPKVRWRAG